MRRFIRRDVAILAAAIVIVVAVVAFASTPAPERPHLGVSNGTSLVVTLFVNDARIAEYPPGGPAPEIDSSVLPPLPWTVEARSSSGRVLTSMRVEPGQVRSAIRSDGTGEHKGVMGRVDLSCGRLTIWAGDIQPSGPVPAESPGQPGDCVP